MRELLRTNDLVLLSFVEATLTGADLPFAIWDQHLSAVEGSIGIFPRRVMIADQDWHRAHETLSAAGLAHELAGSQPQHEQSQATGDDHEADPVQRKPTWAWPWQRA